MDTTSDSRTQQPSRRENKLRDFLGLGEGWRFVPGTQGFVKSQENPIPVPLAQLYERENRHTR